MPAGGEVRCCSDPLRVAAPVDRRHASVDARLRHLPGSVCLQCHDVYAPVVRPTQSLEIGILDFQREALVELTVLKARTSAVTLDSATCEGCGSESESAQLDIAFGENAGLVFENVRGRFCWRCAEATLPNSGGELRERLSRLDLTSAAWYAEPSLHYDAPEHPTMLQLEVTTRCNLTCAYCTNRKLAVRHDVSLAQLRQILANVDWSKVDDIDFTGLGEALLNPDLPMIIQEVKQLGHPSEIRLVTNGVGLTPQRFEPLCRAGLTSMSVSIDSLQPSKFARSRGGARLDRVLENLAKLVAFRTSEDLTLPRIKIKAVLLDDVYNEAEALLRYSAELGVDMPHFSTLDTRSVVQDNYDQPWLLNPWSDRSSAGFHTWCTTRWRELTGNTVTAAGRTAPSPAQRAIGFRHPMLQTEIEACRWATEAAFVGSSGRMLPCCEQMIDMPRTEWGMLSETSLSELWASTLFWAYRLPLSVGAVPANCVGCPWAPLHGVPMSELRSMNRSYQPASVISAQS